MYFTTQHGSFAVGEQTLYHFRLFLADESIGLCLFIELYTTNCVSAYMVCSLTVCGKGSPCVKCFQIKCASKSQIPAEYDLHSVCSYKTRVTTSLL